MTPVLRTDIIKDIYNHTRSASMVTKLFPYTLIVLDVCAAIVYFWHKDIRLGIYWISAACLTICVVW